MKARGKRLGFRVLGFSVRVLHTHLCEGAQQVRGFILCLVPHLGAGVDVETHVVVLQVWALLRGLHKIKTKVIRLMIGEDLNKCDWWGGLQAAMALADHAL